MVSITDVSVIHNALKSFSSGVVYFAHVNIAKELIKLNNYCFNCNLKCLTTQGKFSIILNK